MKSFQAIVIREKEGRSAGRVEKIQETDLPNESILVEVSHSTINYKDALAVTGRGKICRRFPMVGGIDLAGVVLQSEDTSWPVGTRVLINGYGLGEDHWGGLTQFQRVRADWLVRIPERFSEAEAMAIGTAGYTAMLCVQALQDLGVTPNSGPIIVSGATGGVGSVATMLLAKLGYEVTGVSGKGDAEAYLRSLGATNVISRLELDRRPRPLESEQWAGGIDSVGTTTLASMLAQMRYDGVVAACGLAGGSDLPAFVMPFILRGVTLKGIDSVMAPRERRERAWLNLAQLLDPEQLMAVCQTVAMTDVPSLCEDMLLGRIKGRVIVDVKA
jgi:acrylyl-CoA reductase (NADPH)